VAKRLRLVIAVAAVAFAVVVAFAFRRRTPPPPAAAIHTEPGAVVESTGGRVQRFKSSREDVSVVKQLRV